MIAPLRRHPLVALVLVCAVSLGLVLPGAFAEQKDPPEVVRSALAQTGNVRGAPQRTMVLSRVVINPGAQLALHHHEGTQIARIESGVLSYTVERGAALVREGEADQQPRVVRTIAAGQTARVRPGQWMVEQPSDIHRAANRGTVPVVIYLATLLKTGAPPSTPVVLDED